MSVDDVGITYPGARAIPAIFNLFQVPFRGGEKKGAAPPSSPRLPGRRDTSIPSLSLLHLTPSHRRSRGFDTAILRFKSHTSTRMPSRIPATFDRCVQSRTIDASYESNQGYTLYFIFIYRNRYSDKCK